MKTDVVVQPTSIEPRNRKRLPVLILAVGVAVFLVIVIAAMSGIIPSKSKEAADPCRGKGLSCLQDQLNGPNDPCRYVRISDAEKVLGTVSQALPGRTVDKCFLPTFSYRVVSTRGITLYRTAVRSLKDRLQIGNEAFWDPREGVLHVLAGDTYLAIEVNGIAGNREKAIAVAGLALVKIAPESKVDG